MLVLIVCVVVVVLALLVLGVLAYGLLGAGGRLARELDALQRDVAPVAAQLQASLATATAVREQRQGAGDPRSTGG